MSEEQVLESFADYDGLLGVFIVCPKCSMLQAFTNSLPDIVEECPKCHSKIKVNFEKLNQCEGECEDD